MQYRYSIVATLAMSLGGAMWQPVVAADVPARAAQVNIEELRERLALTPEQQAQIAPLAEERRTKMEGIRTRLASASSRQDKRSALKDAKAIQDDFAGKVEPLLTPAQQAEWKKMREEMRAQMKQRVRNR